jgi:hypothetical protein
VFLWKCFRMCVCVILCPSMFDGACHGVNASLSVPVYVWFCPWVHVLQCRSGFPYDCVGFVTVLLAGCPCAFVFTCMFMFVLIVCL